MTHRWLPGDVAAWRRLALAAGACAADLERRGEVRGALVDALNRAERAAQKARFPAAEYDWPRFSQFIRLCRDFATARDDWRKAWTAALDSQAREILRRLGDPPPPGAPAAQQQQNGTGPPPWWLDKG